MKLIAAIRSDLPFHSALLVGVLIAFAQAMGLVIPPFDAGAYWRASDLESLYPATWTSDAAQYIYPPPLAMALSPFRILPYQAFVLVWQTAVFGCFAYVARGWTIPIIAVGWAHMAVPGGVGVFGELAKHLFSWAILGNIQWVIAAICVAGFRRPEFWVFPLLTKVGPGVGLVWFAARGEWMSVLRVLGVALLIAVGTFAAAPNAWRDFVDFAWVNLDAAPIEVIPLPFVVRLSVATIVIVVAARAGQRWLLPAAVAIASPALYPSSVLPGLLASIRLIVLDRGSARLAPESTRLGPEQVPHVS